RGVVRFVKGDVVILPFPFSDLSGAKRRPALVLAALPGDDVILCQITSRAVTDPFAIPIAEIDFVTGGLRQPSNARPNRLFTADPSIILYQAGRLRAEKLREITAKVLDFFNQ